MIPVEVDGLIYVALGGCGMDLQAQLIYTQYKLTDWIELDDVAYLKHQQAEAEKAFAFLLPFFISSRNRK